MRKVCFVCSLKKAVQELGRCVNVVNLGRRLKKEFVIEPVMTIHKKIGKDFYRCLSCNNITRYQNDIAVELSSEEKEELKS